MTILLTAAQMRAAENAAIASGHVTGLELMERAGRGVVDAIFNWRPAFAKTTYRALVLCGPGNNGGDGFVVARLLRKRGWDITVLLYGETEKLPKDAAANCRRWQALGEVKPLTHESLDQLAHHPAQGEGLVIDALFGTGLNRPLPDALGRMLDKTRAALPRARNAWVAVDIASGICADSGRVLGDADVGPADLTVTFRAPKIGHYLGDIAGGALAVVDLGLNRNAVSEAYRKGDVTEDRMCRLVDGCDRRVDKAEMQQGHKYSHGHALVLSGPMARTGAARLAARGALRIGAGLVTVGAPTEALSECAAQLTAIMLREISDATALSEALRDERLSALCLGPGMGTDARTRDMVLAALSSDRACVLDADALSVFADDPADLFATLHEGVVLTPHAGEFRGLFPDLHDRLAAKASHGPAYSKVEAAREAAARAGCTVLFKGADTVIAGPDGAAAINAALRDRAAPWLATAGSGDVLAGFITGLLARGLVPFTAAKTAAWLHVECARSFGPGLIAEDLPEALPGVFRKLGMG